MNGPGGNANGNAAGAGGANQNNQQAGVNDAGSAGGGGGGGNMSTAVEEFFVAHSGGPASSANQFGFGGGGGGGAGDEASSYGDGHGGAGGFGAGGGGGGNGSGGAGGFGGGGGGGGSSGGPNFGTSVFAGGYGGVMTSNSQGIVGSAGGGGAGLGGGIFVNAGLLVLNNCTLTGNSAQGGQAGAGGAQPRASSGAGLAAAVFLLNAPTFITSCTISGNTSSSGGSQVYSLNMGKGSSSTVTLSNTVVGQSGPSAGPDVVIKAIRGGDLPRIRGVNNFVTNPGLIPKSILVGTGDPLLRPLADNGGPTQTMLPMPGSPLLDAGHNAPRGGLAATDQRGQIRLVNAFADIGSVETAGAARPFLREVAVRGTPQLPLRTIVLTFSGPLTAEPGAFRLSRPNGTGVIPVQVREVTRNGYTVVSLIVPAPLAKRTGSFKLVVDGEHLSDANGDPLFALTQERTLSVRSGRV